MKRLLFFYYSNSTIFCRKAQSDHSCFVFFALLFISCPLSSFSGSISAEYLIEFEDQGSTQRVWEELKRVEGKETHASLQLWPYMSYRFRVIAINDVGKSEPSKPSEIHNTAAEGQSQHFVCTAFFFFFLIPCNICTILNLFPITAPDRNPEDVRSESTDPDTLVIAWDVRMLSKFLEVGGIKTVTASFCALSFTAGNGQA